MVKTNYEASDITALEGLDAVRKRPGMYIGSTDVRGLNHLVHEIFDNSVDEVLAGYGTEVSVTINENGSVTVEDNGRGIPVGEHQLGISATEVVFTVLHAGGKFGGGSYQASGGLHGVGSAVVNALSDWLEVTVYREGYEHFVRFEKGKIAQSLERVGKSDRTGTQVTFMPDKEIFSTIKFNRDRLKENLKESAYLSRGLRVKYEDRQKEEIEKEEYYFEGGVKQYVEDKVEKHKPLTDVQYFEFKDEETGIEGDVAYVWVDEGVGETIYSFVNNIRTGDGGTHETGLRTSITRAVNDYAIREELSKNRLESIDIREGLVALVSIRVPENILQFEGQTKDKLGTAQARGVVETFVYDNLLTFLDRTRKFSEYLVDKAVATARLREKMRKERSEMKKSRSKNIEKVILKELTEPTSKKPEERELFLVEGDSAGGTVKNGRDRRTQGILTLRGKVLNAQRTTEARVYGNVELQTIMSSLGVGVLDEYDASKLQYDKVIILTDADVDGSHIQVLLITFFYKYMPQLIEDGHLYVAKPPLYSGKVKGKTQYFWTMEEVRAAGATDMKRFKGLGEMAAEDLAYTSMDPETRYLEKLDLVDKIDTSILLETLMGNDVSNRKEWITENVDFDLEFN